MAMLSPKAKDELKKIYQEECGKVLTDDEAEEMGMRLLRLFNLLTQSTPEEPA